MQLTANGPGKVSRVSMGKHRVSGMYICKAAATETKAAEAHGIACSVLTDTMTVAPEH